MLRQKFRYNPFTLRFERVNSSLFYKVRYITVFLFFACVAGFGINFMYSNFIDSLKVRSLKQEISFLTEKYGELHRQLDEVSAVISEVRFRDDQVYRVIFEKDPIPKEIRRAGFGGVNRYQNLSGRENSKMVIATAKRMDVLLTQLYIQKKSFEELEGEVLVQKEKLSAIPAILPVSGKSHSSVLAGFGIKRHPVLGINRMHKGMDFSLPLNSKIYATGNGVISEVTLSDKGMGNCVVIEHGYGYESVYAHLLVINVKKGQKIRKGQLIGGSGDSGFSSGPHLHYEVHKNGKLVDPANYFFNDLTPKEYYELLKKANSSNTPLD